MELKTVEFYLCIVGVLCPIVTFFVLFLLSGIQFTFHWKPNHSGLDGWFAFRTVNQDIAKYGRSILTAEGIYALGSAYVFFLSGAYWLPVVLIVSAILFCGVSCRRFNRTLIYDTLRTTRGMAPRDGKEHNFWISMKQRTDQEIPRIGLADFLRNAAVFGSLGYNLAVLGNYVVLSVWK